MAFKGDDDGLGSRRSSPGRSCTSSSRGCMLAAASSAFIRGQHIYFRSCVGFRFVHVSTIPLFLHIRSTPPSFIAAPVPTCDEGELFLVFICIVYSTGGWMCFHVSARAKGRALESRTGENLWYGILSRGGRGGPNVSWSFVVETRASPLCNHSFK